jgi:multiple sugar transport system substrate-binding protein
MKDDRERVNITEVSDEVSRQELLRRAAAGAIVLVYGGLGGKISVAGASRYTHQALRGTLRILQWSHFVPAYDRWFDNVYIKRWGERNDVEVKVDHINQADLPARVAAEAAARSGHDIVAQLAPAPQYENLVIDHKELVQEVTRKRGKMARVAYKSTYNPKTKKYHGFSDSYAPDPVNYRIDLWREVGAKPTSWDRVLRAAPRLRAGGHPIGLGMSNEIDSNYFLMALMMCFGSFIQDGRNRVRLNSKATREVLKFGRDLFRRGMTREIFAWTAASNNQAMLAGRLSLALNAISIPRSAELQNPGLARNIGLLPIPEGPKGRLGLEHVMHTYMIWKFARNKRAARKFLVDLELNYVEAFENSKFYNFASWPRSVKNVRRRLQKDDPRGWPCGPCPPRGKYAVLDRISRKYTYNVGHPGFSNAAMGEIFDTWLIPEMFAQVAQGRMTPDEAARSYHRRCARIFAKWRRRGLI